MKGWTLCQKLTLISTPALNGAKDFVSFIDDYSQCTIFYFTKHKNDVFLKIQTLQDFG